MKKIIIFIFCAAIISVSCNYKIISPFIDIDKDDIYDNNDNTTDNNNNNNNLHTVGANSTEEEVKTSLEKNKQLTGKNIIVVTGYIDQNSKIFDNIKKVINGKKDIELDLSKSTLNSSFKGTFENSKELQIVLLPSTKTLIDNFLKGCTSVTSIQLQKTLDTIKPNSLDGCTSLKNVEYLGSSPNIITGNPFTGKVIPSDLYLPNVKEDPKDNSWNKFLGVSWGQGKIHYGKNMPK